MWQTAAMAVLLLAGGTARTQTPPPLDDFFRSEALSGAKLSPSGRYLAVIVGSTTARSRLGVIDLDQRGPAKVVARFEEADVAGVEWVDDERLVFGGRDSERAWADQRARGLWAVNRDGSEIRALIKREWTVEEHSRIVKRVLEPNHHLRALTHDGSGDVIVGETRWSNLGDLSSVVLHRLDTRTGAIRAIGNPPDNHVRQWVLDARGEPRAARSYADGRSRLYWRASKDAPWTLLFDEPAAVGSSIEPAWVDGDQLFVIAPSGPARTHALFRFDVEAKALSPEPLFRINGFDYLGGRETDGDGRTVGIHYQAEAGGSHWFDASLAAAQREVDALLPGTANRLSCSRCTDAKRLLVRSSSDRQPEVFRIFDLQTRKLEIVGAARPWIDPKQMAEQDFVRVTARDGRSIPVYVTRPRGKADGPRPAVVLVHGGPQVRGTVWGWESEAQFLASRGYVVIEPEFRGSDGFGAVHLQAGFRQWGLAMQDDVTDATHWAIREAGVDARRICIAGASYGGYAAMMGLVREPELYRCGINWVGVTDIGLMFSIGWSDLPEDWKRYGLRTLVGDPIADKARFEQTSPVAQAQRITQPVLMAYGGVDRRVPIEHGTRLRDAIAKHNRDVEWVVYPDEGHGFLAPENVRDFWTRVEKFLARNLAAPVSRE